MVPAIDSVFDALDGVAYWTDRDGVIQGGGVRNWTAFAVENGSANLKLGDLVGQNLFDHIHGPRMRDAYRRLSRLVVEQQRPHVVFGYRCDGPLIARQMRMTLGAITDGRGAVGVLYHSQVLEERERPFGKPFARRDAVRPQAVVCGFCLQVKRGESWVRPRVYYADGGPSEVSVQHDVCPSCEQTLSAL